MQNRRSALAWIGVISRRRALAEEVARLRRHPRLAEFAEFYCSEMTAHAMCWPASKLLSHKARYVICFRLIANSARWQANAGEPPTLAALKAPAYASERQVADFVAQLRWLGLVTAIPLPTDHRMAALHPSPRLITEISRHPRLMAQLYASLAEPDALAAADPDTAQILDLMVRATTVATQEDLSELAEPPFPIVDHFARHDGGYLILMTVLRAHYRRGDAGMDLAYGALVSHFGISLAHVGKLMREARCAGWFEVPRGGAPCAVSPALVQQFEHFLAEQAAHFGTLVLPQSSIGEACTL